VKDEDLLNAAGDYVRGDLEPEERREFEELAASSPSVRKDLEFWERIGPALRRHGREDGRVPGHGIAEAIHRRTGERAAIGAALDTVAAQRAKVVPWVQWIPAGIAAAAAILVLTLNLAMPRTVEIVAWPDFGGTGVVVDPANPDTLPLRALNVVDARDRTSHETHERRWLGLLARPVEMRGFEFETGLAVLRVVVGSPAYEAGLRPGDILTSVNGDRVATAHCIARCAGDLEAGDRVPVTFYRPETGTEHEVLVTIGACVE